MENNYPSRENIYFKDFLPTIDKKPKIKNSLKGKIVNNEKTIFNN